jgi:hypothetical protein
MSFPSLWAAPMKPMILHLRVVVVMNVVKILLLDSIQILRRLFLFLILVGRSGKTILFGAGKVLLLRELRRLVGQPVFVLI